MARSGVYILRNDKPEELIDARAAILLSPGSKLLSLETVLNKNAERAPYD